MNYLYLVAFFFLLILSLIYAFSIKDIANPFTIFIFSTSLGFWMYYIFIFNGMGILLENKATLQTYLFSIIFFGLGYFYFIRIGYINKKFFSYKINNTKLYKLVKFFVVMGCFGFLINLIQIVFLLLKFNGQSIGFIIRYNTVYEGLELYGKYFLLLLNIATIILILNRKIWKIKPHKIYLCVFIWLFNCFFTMARTEILLCLSSVSYAWYYEKKFISKEKIKYKFIIFIGVLFLMLFCVFAFLTNRTEDGSIFQSLIMYMGYNLVTFDKYYINFPQETNGINVFNTIFKIFQSINIHPQFWSNLKSIPIYDSYTTGTAISIAYIDFGQIGTFILFFILGYIYRILYNFLIKGNFIFVILYSFIIFPLLISFFDYTFSYILWLYYFIILIFIYIFTKQRSN